MHGKKRKKLPGTVEKVLKPVAPSEADFALDPQTTRQTMVLLDRVRTQQDQAESLSGEPGATKRYLAFISAGKSKYPIDLLKDAGVDMTTDEPLELTVQKMNRVMDEMEKLLGRKSSSAGE